MILKSVYCFLHIKLWNSGQPPPERLRPTLQLKIKANSWNGLRWPPQERLRPTLVDCFCAFVYAATAQFRGFSAYKPHLVLFCTAAPIKAPACFLTELAQCYSLTFHHVWSHFGGFGVVYTKHVLRSEHSTMVHVLGKGWHFTVLAPFSTPAYAQALPAYSTFVGRFLPLGS